MNNGLHVLRNLLGAAAAGALLLTLLPGCGKAAETITETAIEASMPNGGNVEIDSEDGTFSIQTSDGQGGTASVQGGESVALPDNFPSDIPVPDGVTWNIVQNATTEGKSGLLVQGRLDTPVAEVAGFMKKEAESNGWTNEQAVQQGGQMEMLTYTKEERRLHVTISHTGDGTALVITSQ